MWAVRSASAKPSRGEAVAIQRMARPARKDSEADVRELRAAGGGAADGEPAADVDHGGEEDG